MSKVPPKDWTPPEHLSLSERDFLVDRAETINGIVAASYLQVGQVLLQVKRKFKRDPDLDGWFKKWIEETLPINYIKAMNLYRIAEEAEDDPKVLDAVKNGNFKVVYDIITIKSDARDILLDAIIDGETIHARDVTAVKSIPEVQLGQLRSQVESMEMTLLNAEMKLAGSTDNDFRRQQNQQVKRSKERLSKALSKLQEKEAEVESLGKERSTQDLVLQTLKKQLKQKEVVIENMSLDPEQKRKRALAQTVVDATKGLDLLLSSIDRYGTDKPELGMEAISTIERKMDEVKLKLLEHYASNLPSQGGST